MNPSQRVLARSMPRAYLIPGLILAALVLGASSARADSIDVTGVDSTRGVSSLWINERGTNKNTYFTGVIFITLTDSAGRQYQRDTLCADLFTNINLGATYQTVVYAPSHFPAMHLPRTAWLVANALLLSGSTHHSDLPESDWATTPQKAAGLQLAIWDIVHDNGDGFSAGNVRKSTSLLNPTDPTVLQWAQTYESLSLGKSSELAYVYQNRTLRGVEVQMLIGPQFLDGGPHPVPEPSEVVLTATGFGFLVRVIVRRRRAQKAAGG